MAAWNELSCGQLEKLSTKRLYEIFKKYQFSFGYRSYEKNECGIEPPSDDSIFRVRYEHIKSILDKREHLDRVKDHKPKDGISRARKRLEERYAPKLPEREGPIKDAVACIGKQVFKRSKKPFKSRNKYNTVKAVTTNPHTQRVAFSFEEDTSTVDVHLCNVREK